MKRWRHVFVHGCIAAAVALAVGPLAGCEIYFGDDDDQCVVPPTEEGFGHRNPHNGACEPFDNGGGGGCFGGDDTPAGTFEAPVAFDWGDCPSSCEQLGEQECLASADCHATYVDCAPGGNCDGPWRFNECWDLPPSGGNYGGEQCQGLDAEGCNRNADCVSNYHAGDSGEGYPSGGGPLTYDSCGPEGGNFGGCFSQADCPDGTVCTAETECLPPPGCTGGMDCPDVCFGRCVPTMNTCAAIDCAPGYHCEENCMSCDPDGGPCDPSCQGACVPDQDLCPISCPPDSVCQQVCGDCMDPNDPNDPMCGDCHPACVPVGDDDPPPLCADDVCMAGTHCEVQCTADAAGNVHCERACVPDVDGCAPAMCPAGSECVETCVPPPPACMGGPVGCPPTCTIECVPTMPATCETQQSAPACESVPGCEPVFTATCTPNPDGTFTCSGFTFVACQDEGAPTPLPPMM
jgi:hypothetical protein